MFSNLSKYKLYIVLALVIAPITIYGLFSSAAIPAPPCGPGGCTITLSVSPSSVASTSGAGTYENDPRINISTSLYSSYVEKYKFKYWQRSDGSNYTNNPLSVLVDVDKSFKAFYNPMVTAAVSPSGAGYVNSNGGGISNCGKTGGSCAVDYSRASSEGSKYTNLTAYTNAGYRFKNWSFVRSGQTTVNTSTTNPRGFDQYYGWKATANYDRIYYTVSTAISPSGSGSVSGGGSVAHGGSKTLTASAASGYKFSSWSGSCSGTSTTYTLSNITSNKSCTANFVKATTTSTATYTVSTSVSPSGSGSVSGGGSVTSGGSKTLTASAASGYKFSSWSGSCSGTSTTYTLSSITSNKSCTSNFVKATTSTSNTTTKTTTTTALSTTNNAPKPRTTVQKNSTVTANDSDVPNDTEKPTLPKDLSATYEAVRSAVYIEWTPSTDNVAVDGYEIRRREGPTNSWESISDSIYSASYTDINIGSEKSYEYSVRAYDAKKNYSDWSSSTLVSTGPFQPNVTAKDGGTVENEDATVIIEVQQGVLNEDLFFSIEPVDFVKLGLPKGYRLIGYAYEIRAKNRNGEEVTKFEAPISIKYLVTEAEKEKIYVDTLKLAFTPDNLITEEVESFYDQGNGVVSSQVDHLTPYYVIGKNKSSFWAVLKNISIGLLLLGIIAAPIAYLYYRKLQKLKNYEEIQEDLKY